MHTFVVRNGMTLNQVNRYSLFVVSPAVLREWQGFLLHTVERMLEWLLGDAFLFPHCKGNTFARHMQVFLCV